MSFFNNNKIIIILVFIISIISSALNIDIITKCKAGKTIPASHYGTVSSFLGMGLLMIILGISGLIYKQYRLPSSLYLIISGIFIVINSSISLHLIKHCKTRLVNQKTNLYMYLSVGLMVLCCIMCIITMIVIYLNRNKHIKEASKYIDSEKLKTYGYNPEKLEEQVATFVKKCDEEQIKAGETLDKNYEKQKQKILNDRKTKCNKNIKTQIDKIMKNIENKPPPSGDNAKPQRKPSSGDDAKPARKSKIDPIKCKDYLNQNVLKTGLSCKKSKNKWMLKNHPDKVPEQLKDEATKVFQYVNECIQQIFPEC